MTAVRVTIVDPPPALRLGMTASVILPTPAAPPEFLLVPATAVFEHQGRQRGVDHAAGRAVGRAVLRKDRGTPVPRGWRCCWPAGETGETIAVAGVH